MNATPARMATPAPKEKSSLFQSAKAVAWAFLGIRRNSDYQRDMRQLNPFHIILVALVAVAVFVAGLAGLVHWIVN